MIGFFSKLIGFLGIILYVSGMFLLWSSDKYSSKQLLGGLVFPPYSVYIGGKDLYDRGTQGDNYSIKDYAEDLNSELPRMIEEGVQAQSVEAIKKDTLLFKIKLTVDIDISKKKILYVPFLESYCEGEMKPFYDNKINLVYVLEDKRDEILTRFELTPKRCKSFEIDED